MIYFSLYFIPGYDTIPDLPQYDFCLHAACDVQNIQLIPIACQYLGIVLSRGFSSSRQMYLRKEAKKIGNMCEWQTKRSRLSWYTLMQYKYTVRVAAHTPMMVFDWRELRFSPIYV